jgi:hypothetical protein
MSNLVLYDKLRAALVACVKVDEVVQIKDEAEKLAAYARIVNDVEAEMKFAELRLRAVQRLGELSIALDKAKLAGKGTVCLPNGGKTKAQALADVGISTSTAQRYEQLAGGRRAHDQKAARVAADRYFAGQRERRTPPTMDGLQAAVDESRGTRPTLLQPSQRAVEEAPRQFKFKRLPVVEERPTIMAPYYHVPTTYEEGLERAAALLDDMAKEDPRPSLEQAAARVRKLKEH